MSDPTEPIEPVRVGDRYVREDGAKITITAVELYRADYSVMTEEGTIWSSYTTIPVPELWTKAGSGPVPEQEKIYCLDHPLREVEPGLDYCFECIDARAADWSQVDPRSAIDSLRLLRKRREERK